MGTHKKIPRAVEDLNVRLKTEEKALGQAQKNKEQMLNEKQALIVRLAVADKKHDHDIQKRLTALDKRFRFQCELEERHRIQIQEIKTKQQKISEDFPSLIKTGPYDALANARFLITHHADEHNALHVSSPAVISIHRLVHIASKLTPKGKERFCRYVTLNGIAQAKTLSAAPISCKKTACYEAFVNLILEDGTETLTWHDESLDTLCIKDKHTNDKLYVAADGYGARLCMETLIDTVMSADELPSSIKDNIRLPSYILKYHVVEKGILPGCPLQIEGKVYMNNQALHICHTADKAHTVTVALKKCKTTPKKWKRLTICVCAGVLILTVILLLPHLF